MNGYSAWILKHGAAHDSREAIGAVAERRRAKRSFGEAAPGLTAVLAFCAVLDLGRTAGAADATWLASPADGDFNNAANWDTAAVPDGMAFFDASSITGLSFSADTTLGGWTFNGGAPAYSFTVGVGRTVEFNGDGIVNGSGAGITNDGTLSFLNSASAGDATITTTNGGTTVIDDSASGGDARFITDAGGTFDISGLSSSGTTAGSIEGAGDYVLGAKNLEVGSNDLSTTVTGVISGPGGSLTKVGTGTLILSGTNTYTGATTVDNGILQITGSIASGTVDTTGTGRLGYAGSSSAGSATITNDWELVFTNNSSAGSATITNDGLMWFSGDATAGSATIANNGVLNVTGTSDAGTAQITNNLALNFESGTSAGSANITNNDAMSFFGGTGGTATVQNNDTLTFFGGTAGDATITTSNGALVRFLNSSGGGNARFITQSGGTFNISGLSTSGTSGGSIEGGGNYVLGGKNLQVGWNDLSTTVSGVISGSGGSLTKVGNGTLTLSGINTYTGATTVDGGTLEVSGSIASATIDINAAGRLDYTGTTDAGSATITNDGDVNFLDTASAGNAIFTNNDTLGFNEDSSAGSAAISNAATGTLNFDDNATAATATITNDGDVLFLGTSTAGDATITNNDAVNFTDTSRAEDAVITTANGATTLIESGASGGDARFITQSGGTFSISGLSGSGTTAGSIEGAGSHVLGAKNLEVGSNDLSTTVSGVVSGVGGSLTKVGNGTLELSGTNTYTGATTVDDGTLQISGSIASATVDVNAGGIMDYIGTSDAGTAAISNDGVMGFYDAATAGNSTVDNNNSMEFFGSSTAGDSAITNDGTIIFHDTTTASDATITTTNGAGVQFQNTASGGDARFITQSGGTFTISGLSNSGTTAGSIEGAGNYSLGAKNLEVGSNDLSAEVSGVISGMGGSLTKVGNGTLELSGTNTYTGTTTVDGGTLEISGSIASSTVDVDSGTLLYSGTANAGTATITTDTGAGLEVTDSATLNGVDVINNGFVSIQDTATAGGSDITNNNTLQFEDSSTAGSSTITTTNGATTEFNGTSSGGSARLITQSGGMFDFSGLSSAGTTAGTIEGDGDYVLGNKNLEVGSNNTSTAVNGVISGVGGSLTKTGSGTLNLTGTNTYTGATDVDDGTLRVNGSIAASSLTTINSGATLGGTGTLGDTTISGGTLAPGNSIGTITVNGNLTFGPGSLYLVEVSPTDADRTNVTGTATLDGAVTAIFEAGSYMDNSYTILSAAGGLGGSTFDSLNTINLPAGFEAELDYSGGDVLLNLTATVGGGSSGGLLARNQQNVLDSVVNFFDGGGSLPPGFVTVLGLNGGELSTALSQISGEAATAAQRSAHQTMNRFLAMMLDPLVSPPANQSLPPEAASGRVARPISFARVPEAFEAPRWNAWASAYGGINGTDGDAAGAGSHGTSTRMHGFAAGMMCAAAPDRTIGFAVLGGGTSWNLSDDLGGGGSKTLQAGLHGSMRWDAFYAAAAMTYGFHDMSTDRFTFGGDRLGAAFDAHSIGARIEGGTRFETETGGVVPYAALQAQSFYTPRYTEDDPGGSGFGLSCDERVSASLRSELGSRFDFTLPMDEEILLNLNARLAHVRNWMTDSSVTAAFQSLPGTSFTVKGAPQPRNIGLISLGTSLLFPSGLSLSLRFNGEFAGGYATYGGVGSVQVNW